MKEKLLSTGEVAELIGKNNQTVRRWCRDGILPARYIGRSYRIDPKELDEWLGRREGSSLEQPPTAGDLAALERRIVGAETRIAELERRLNQLER